ncbi:MAG: hypothetical protein IPO52_00695 [Gemmatimonadetes bacterium]|nr:hypothetical protein [Gemmatimonadota bacterium]
MTAFAAEFPNDPDLVAAWRRGDEQAATHLVKRHAPALGRYVAAGGASSADVEDLVQETFIRAFRGLDSWRGDGPFRGGSSGSPGIWSRTAFGIVGAGSTWRSRIMT